MSDRLVLRTFSPQETEGLGELFGACLRPGDLVRLQGELGAGKTTFCRGVGRGLAIEEPLHSPTYLLCKEYPTLLGPLLHLDGYFDHRLASLLGEGLIERIDGRSMVLIEWAERVQPWLPEQGLLLRFEREATCDGVVGSAGDPFGSEDEEDHDRCPRALTLEAAGAGAQKLLGRFSEKLDQQGISVEPDPEPTR